MTKDEAMEQIRKLLAMSDHEGSNPNEAERAAMHARRLLEKFQLSVADIEKGEVGEELSKEEVELAGGRRQTWQYALAEAVSSPLDCRYIFYRQWNGPRDKHGNATATTVITFVGYDSDTQIARYLFVHLSRVLHDMGTKEGKERGRAGAQLISYRGNFIVGAASSIRRRLMEDKKAPPQPQTEAEAQAEDQAAMRNRQSFYDHAPAKPDSPQPSAATALVLLKKPKVEAFFEQEYPDVTNARPRGYSDQAALYHGRKAGETIPLRKGVEGSKPAGQLGVS